MHGPFFILTIIAIVMAALVAKTWIRAHYGHPVGRQRGRDRRAVSREAELVAIENERLKGMVGRLEERVAVLERIATDQPNRLSAEIERLREQPLL